MQVKFEFKLCHPLYFCSGDMPLALIKKYQFLWFLLKEKI
jgi:hypothetical protein